MDSTTILQVIPAPPGTFIKWSYGASDWSTIYFMALVDIDDGEGSPSSIRRFVAPLFMGDPVIDAWEHKPGTEINVYPVLILGGVR